MSDSRAALLAAAAEEFARYGRKGARIQAIVQRAGVNERMIYHHFGSKDGLYAAVLEAQGHGLVEAWRKLVDQAAELPPYQGMRAVLAGFADSLAAPRCWWPCGCTRPWTAGPPCRPPPGPPSRSPGCGS